MNQYVIDTEYAVRGLISLITDQEAQLKQLQERCQMLSCKAEAFNVSHGVSPFETMYLQDQADAVTLAITRQQLEETQKQVTEVTTSIDAKSDSVTALSTALLQIAKQGISTVYGNLSSCHDGRTIGREKLKNIVWQARNQSMHYEEISLRPPVYNCFASIESTFGDKFSLSSNLRKNLAYEVIDVVLGWKDYSRYEGDMRQLL